MKMSVQQPKPAIDCTVEVVNVLKSEYDIAIDRHYGKGMEQQILGEPGCFGNPYKMGEDGDRDAVVRKFAQYFLVQWQSDARLRGWWAQQLAEHETIRLGCHCAPKACHGDIM